MSVITLLTDFGLKDGYPAVMKGVIWGIAPHAQIADITHLISPQDIREGSYSLSRTAPFFPPGTVHVAVVDPGVGTKRRPIAAQFGNAYFVGPDNGLCTLLLNLSQSLGEETQIVHLDRPEFWLKHISSVFHGRDIFAPVAAHILNGRRLCDLGTPINDPITLKIPVPERTRYGWRGEVILMDNFGNLSTNLTRQLLEGMHDLVVNIAGHSIRKLVNTFGSGQPGDLVALIGEADDLCIAVVNGNAAQTLGVFAGEPIEVSGMNAPVLLSE